jgi:hypothetical protein
MKKKIFAIMMIAVLVVNLVLYALGESSHLAFYLVAGIIALFAYIVLPKLR